MEENKQEKRIPKFFVKNYAKLFKDAIISRLNRSNLLCDAEISYIEGVIEQEYTEIQKLQIDDIEKEYDILLKDLKDKNGDENK